MFGVHSQISHGSPVSRRDALLLGGLVLFTTSACSGSGDATANINDPYLKDLYDKARAEGGKVVLYTHLTPPDQQQALVSAFKHAYPGITVDVTAGVGSDILQRLLTEKRAGRNSVDVFQYPGLAPFEFELYPEMEKYVDGFTPHQAENYRQQGSYIAEKAYPWTSYHMGVCYNSDLLNDSQVNLLHSYQGWTDPMWRGRAAITDTSSATGAQGLFQWVYQDPNLGEGWFKRLADLRPAVYSDVNLVVDRVISGEYLVAFDNLDVMQGRMADKGAPLKCAFGEYAPMVSAGMGLIKDAPHPAAGQLFIEWLLSEQGQTTAQDITKGLSMRDGMQNHPVKGGVQPPRDVRVVNEVEFTKRQKDLTDLFNRLVRQAGS